MRKIKRLIAKAMYWFFAAILLSLSIPAIPMFVYLYYLPKIEKFLGEKILGLYYQKFLKEWL